jgi:hypothetical protein
MTSVAYVLYLLSQKDPLSLAISFRFDDKGLFLVGELFAEFAKLGGEQPCSGEEVVMLRCPAVHVHEAETQQILPGKNMNTRKMAHFLVELKFDEEVRLNVVIGPENVPRSFGLEFANNFPLQFFCYFFDHVIVCDWTNDRDTCEVDGDSSVDGRSIDKVHDDLLLLLSRFFRSAVIAIAV